MLTTQEHNLLGSSSSKVNMLPCFAVSWNLSSNSIC